MPFKPHDSVNKPDPDTKVWRYYSTSQFLWILQQKSLYLSRLDQMEDPFEGYSPAKNLQEEVEAKEENNNRLEKLVEGNIDLGEPHGRTKETYELLRRMSLVNCWSEGEEDSLSMWKSYLPSGDGVAVCSTFQDLVDAIDQESNFTYYAGEVTYFDYFDDFKKVSNFFEFIMSKPKQYTYETEIRIFVWWPTSGKAELDDPELGESVKDALAAPTGIKVDVNLDTLIDGVYVSPFGPAWLTAEYWNEILDKFDIDATAEMSQLAMEPADILDEE